MTPGVFVAQPVKRRMPVYTLRMTEGIPAMHAVMCDLTRIRCASIFIQDVHPIAALCRELTALGHGELALRVTWSDGSPATFVNPISFGAWSAAKLLR